MASVTPAQSGDDRLALLYRLSRTFNSTLNLDEVLNRVMDEVIAATGAERGFVMLQESDGQLSFRVARGMDQNTVEDPQFHVSRGVVEQVAQRGQPVLTSDAQTDDRFRMRTSVVALGLHSILCVPLKVKDAVTGVVYVDNRLQSGVFVQEDLDLLTAIASTAAIAIENARLYRIAVEKGRMERELQMAREVQSSLLPKATPKIDGWEFAAYWQPAREVAGDFYDFFPVDLHPAADRRHAPGVGIVMGDVSDKGMPAALFMALSRSTVRASLHRAPSPAEGIARANRLLRADAAGRMFVTLFYALLDPEAGRVTYVNAGHNPALLSRRGEGSPEEPLQELAPTGMALGVLDGEAFEQRTVQLDRGDYLLIYTDGVTDAMAANGERFGTDRLGYVLRVQRTEPADAVVDALRTELGRFTHATEQFDDIAMVVVRRS